MDDRLRPYMDDFVVCYLNDILIYSEDPAQHEGHVTKVLERLCEYGLYCKAEKSEFNVKKVGFLGFVIAPDGIEMEANEITTIEDWPTPMSVKDVQVPMGFTNFYRRFVKKYAQVTANIPDLLKKPSAGGSEKWEWTREADAAFQKLKRAFLEAPILQHFDAEKPITLPTDASGFAIASFLNQFDGFGVLRTTSFYSRKCNPTEQNYDTYDRQLLAIVASMKHWRHHLEGTRYKILIQCDDKNLVFFQTNKVLSRRQARWAEILSAYDFTIEHLDSIKNPADGPSRRPDYKEGYQRPSARLLATSMSYQYLFANAVKIEPIEKGLFPEIIEAQKTDQLGTELLGRLGRDHVTEHMTEEETTTEFDSAISAGALTCEGRVYVPDSDELRSKVIARHYDTSDSGHFGPLKIAELISRNFYWPALQTSVRQYVAGCEVCHRVKAARHAKYGVNMPLEPPNQPWEGVTMVFITDLPESTASAYTGILVIVDRLTKMAIYLPCRKDVDSPELARMFFEEVICKHAVPSNIVTDRGAQFTSRFWNRVYSHLSIDHRSSTSLNPQTDGQTERQNQTMEQYLRAFATYEQDNWVELLPVAEFAYNNSVHATTRLTPFFANYGYYSEMHFKLLKDARFRSERATDVRLGKLQAARSRLRGSILEAQEHQTRYAGGKEMTFEVGHKVWLSARHIQTARPSKKLYYKRLGPFKVTNVINRNAYRLELPYSMKVHNVFHVSLLDRYIGPIPGQQPSDSPPAITAENPDDEEWLIERVLDLHKRYKRLWYLVQWAGHNYVNTSWEPAENLEGASEAVAGFHRENRAKPRV
jgi:hypothetical protein